LRDAGRPKAEAVADLIWARNPNAQVQTIIGRVEAHSDTLQGVDLVVVGVDGELVKYTINEVCRDHDLTAIYAGVYERGEGGDVVIIRPNRAEDDPGPCYACWAAQLREDVAQITARESADGGELALDYGMIGADGTIAAEPGLFLHVVRVASAQADLALNELLHGQTIHHDFPANTVVFANRPLEIIEGQVVPPYSAVWVNIRRDRACLVCGLPAPEALSLEALAGDLIDNYALTDGAELSLEEELAELDRQREERRSNRLQTPPAPQGE
jgi:hypothetical protein